MSVLVVLWPATTTSLFAAAPSDSSAASPYPFVFRDVGDEAGVFPHVAGIRAHAVAWGDVDSKGYPSLFVGTFHNAGSKASMLLRNDHGKFHLDEQEQLRTSGINSGVTYITNSFTVNADTVTAFPSQRIQLVMQGELAVAGLPPYNIQNGGKTGSPNSAYAGIASTFRLSA